VISNKLLSNAVVGICILIFLLAMVGPVSGTEIHVNVITNGTSAQFQAMVNATHDGDTISLDPSGIYMLHNIYINKSLTIQSDGGTAQNTIIDGTGGDRAIFYDGSGDSAGKSLTIKNLTLRNGNYSYSTNGGGAISTYSNVIVISSDFINDTTLNNLKGGAISIHSSGKNLTVTGSNFTDCHAGYGGAISVEQTAYPIVNSSSFINCSATGSTGSSGGAISIGFDSSAGGSVNFCRFGNITSYDGSIIYQGSGSYQDSRDLNENWWGTNNPDFWTLTKGKSMPTTYLKMGLTSSASSITTAQQSTIGVNFSYDNTNTLVSNNILPDAIPVIFTVRYGVPAGSGFGSSSSNLQTPRTYLTSGHSASTNFFSPTAGGNALINVSVDGYNVSAVWVNVSPLLTGITPDNGLNTSTKAITLTGNWFNTTPSSLTTINLSRSGYANTTLSLTSYSLNSLTATVPAGMTAGTWNVSVIHAGEWETTNASVTFQVNDLRPIVSFVGSPLTGTAPLTVQFNDTSTQSPDSWSWSFGDGSSSTDQNATHQYATAGTYTVALTATNNTYGPNTLSKVGYIVVTSSGNGNNGGGGHQSGGGGQPNTGGDMGYVGPQPAAPGAGTGSSGSSNGNQPGPFETPIITPVAIVTHPVPIHVPTILDMILPVLQEYQFWLILIIIIIILIAILRRWWVRRQNPGLFRKYD
jgi:PKD repeat protein